MQAGQRVGVGGVPRFDALRLGELELLEENGLELLGRAEVELSSDDCVSLLGCCLHFGGEAGFEIGKVVSVGCDPDLLHIGENVYERQLDIAQQRHAVLGFELSVEYLGEIDHSPRTHHERVRLVGLVPTVKRELPVRGLLGTQLPAEEAQGQVGEIEGPLAGKDEVGRKRGVAAQAAKLPATSTEAEQRTLRAVDD